MFKYVTNKLCLFEMMWTFGFNDAFCGKLIFLGIEKKISSLNKRIYRECEN